MKRRFAPFFLAAVLVIFVFTGCPRKRKDVLEREDLFRIDLGQMADELNYFFHDNYQLSGISRIFMRDGIFYISGSGSGKVMELTSYGDLITLIYNEDKAPPYVETLAVQTETDGETNRNIKTWPFLDISALSVSQNYIYVGDVLASDKQVWSDDQQQYLSDVVLRFNQDGDFIDALGQEGIGTLAFPKITDLCVREDNEVVVICRTSVGWKVFWFSDSGDLLYLIDFNEENLPFYKEEFRPSLYSLKPSLNKKEIYLQLDYIPLDLAGGQNQPRSRLYTFSLVSKKYDKGIAIPDSRMMIDGKSYDVPYMLLGTTASGFHYFISPAEMNRYNLLITGLDSQVVTQKKIEIEEDLILYKDLFLTPEGIITMVAYLQEGARISWWRADKLLPALSTGDKHNDG